MIPLYLSRRYLFGRAGRSLARTVSRVSLAGMSVGVAALLAVLSVYNGFDSIIRENISALSPDLRIEPARGKFFPADSIPEQKIREAAGACTLETVLEDNVFLVYGEREAFARARGENREDLLQAEIAGCSLGAGLARSLGANPRFNTPLTLWYPRRGAAVNTLNPLSSMKSTTLFPFETFSVNAETDSKMLILPLGVLQELIGAEASAVEVRLESPKGAARICRKLSRELGEDWKVLTREQQNESLYKMMRSEKLAVALILFCILAVIATGVYASGAMFLEEKKKDVFELGSMGVSGRSIRRTFFLRSLLITLVGLAIGLTLGAALALLQQRFGIIKMPGSLSLEAYPAVLKFSDLLWTAVGTLFIGGVAAAAALPSSKR